MNKPTNSELLSALKPSVKQMEMFHATALTRGRRTQMEILVVEDQPFSRQLLVGMLKQNYTTHAAANAVDAWAQYLTYAPDITLLDIELPDINGHKLARLIKAVDPASYLVMVTANNNTDDVVMAKESGAKGFIIKPYSKDKIIETIQNFINDRKTKK